MEFIPLFQREPTAGAVFEPGSVRLSRPYGIQSPGYTQSYNRYSYVWNNPMKYVDPSGYYSQYYSMMLESSADGDKFYYRGEYVTVYDGVGYSGNGSPVPLPLLPSSYYSYDARMQMMQPLPGGINITPGSWQRINFNIRIPSLGNLFDKSGFRMRGIMSYNWNFSFEFPVWRSVKSRRYESLSVVGYSDNYSLLAGMNGPSKGEQGARGVAANSGGGKWETLAFGMTDDFTVAVGPLGFSFEIGSFKYNGKEYSITSLGHAMGLDISAGINAILIKGLMATRIL